jgi:hypothetical protein
MPLMKKKKGISELQQKNDLPDSVKIALQAIQDIKDDYNDIADSEYDSDDEYMISLPPYEKMDIAAHFKSLT